MPPSDAQGCGQSKDKVDPHGAFDAPPEKRGVSFPESSREEMFSKKKTPEKEPPPSPDKTPSVDEKLQQAVASPDASPMASMPGEPKDSAMGEGEHNMAEVALALTSEADVRKLAGIILGKCRLLARGDRSTLFLMDESTRELVEFAYDGGGEVELREHGLRVQIGSGVAGHCGASGNIEVIDNAYDDKRWAGQDFDRQTNYKTQQLLCCPIKGPTQKVLGVMQIVNTKHGGPFAKKDVDVVQAMAASAGVALENASNLSKAQEKEKQLNALLSAMDALLFTFDPDGRLVSCNKTSEGSIRWKGYMGKHFSEWLSERNGELEADMKEAYERKKTAFAPNYAFKAGLAHAYVNYKAIPINDAAGEFQGVLLLMEPCSNHAMLVQSLSRTMDGAAVASALTINDEKLKGKPATLTLLVVSVTGPSLASTAAPEMRLAALNEVTSAVAALVQKDGGMVLQLSGHTTVAAFGYQLAPTAAPIEAEVHAGAACRCARSVIAKVDKMVEAKKKKVAGGADKKKAVELAVAAGVHTGVTAVGTVGLEKLISLAVLGDTATLACCVHGAAAASGAPLVVSADTLALLQRGEQKADFAHARALPRARLPAAWVPSSGPSGDVLAAVASAAPASDGEMELIAMQLLTEKAAAAAEAPLKAYAEGLEAAQAGTWAAAIAALKPHAATDGPSAALLAQCEAAEAAKLDLAGSAGGRRLMLPPLLY